MFQTYYCGCGICEVHEALHSAIAVWSLVGHGEVEGCFVAEVEVDVDETRDCLVWERLEFEKNLERQDLYAS